MKHEGVACGVMSGNHEGQILEVRSSICNEARICFAVFVAPAYLRSLMPVS